MRNIRLTIVTVGILVLAISPVQAETVAVPNGDFELLYKPGTAITGSVSVSGWTQGVGPNCPIDSGEYVFSDASTGSEADIAGWIGYDREGWIAFGGTYGRDQTTGNLQGSLANQGNHTPGGSQCYLVNGSNWGNSAGGLIVSEAPVGNILSNTTYTLSMYVMGSASPVRLDLLADGELINPSSFVSPALGGSWQEFSRTYDAADLRDQVGKAITIVLGVARNASGNQTNFDDVSLSYGFAAGAINPIPENESEHIALDQVLNWTGPLGGNPTYDFYLSSTDADLGPGTQKLSGSSSVVYDPDLDYATTYYWRVDVHTGGNVYTGDRWTFTTGGKPTDPTPEIGMENVKGPTVDLSWTGDAFVDSYKIYAGTELPLSYIGEISDWEYAGLEIPKRLTRYYWRVDAYIGAELIVSGDLWQFTTSQGQIERPAGDLNGDWEVGLADLEIFAEQWLDGPGCAGHPDDCGDLVGGDGVDSADFAVLSANWQESVNLQINELMASNASTLQDDHGEYDDWIEIYNPKGIPVDIGGMYLTDNLSMPTKWRIPSDSPSKTTIDPQGYLVLWADGDPEQGPLHLDFKFENTGDEVGLFARDGSTLLDSIEYGWQVTDISFGNYPDAAENNRFFDQPTPESENVSGYLGRVSEPEFSVGRGFYDEAFEVVLTCPTEDAEIYYTLDSSDPTEGSALYTGPIEISGTACLRAASFKRDYLPSVNVTHTYIYVADVIEQPEMSTTITHDPVWGPQMEGALLEIPSISLVTPYTIPNEPIESPPEVPTSIEMIFPDGTKGFQANAGVERFGGQYTVWPKQALRVSFKSIYGPSRLEYDLFSDTPYGGEDATDSFNQIILRQGSHDSVFYDGYTSKGVYTRNQYCFDRQIEMGHPSLRGKFVHMYLNGTYWGLYHLMERPTADFMASYLGGDREDYDIVKGRGGLQLMEGTRTAWDHLVANTGNYEIVKNFMDVDNYIDYMILNYYGGNDHDWYPSHNWVAGRKREFGNKFKFFMWDNDFCMRANGDTTNNGGPGNMQDALKQHEEFRIRMADRAQKHLFNDGMLTPARVQADFTELTKRVERVIIPECARWSQIGSGGAYTPDTLQQSVDWIKFAHGDVRTGTVVQQMRDEGLFPAFDAPEFKMNGVYQHGGYASKGNSLTMTNPDSIGTVYCTLDGSDPRLYGGGVNPSAIIFETGDPVYDTTDLVEMNKSEWKYLYGNNDLGTSWRRMNFDDSSWASGPGQFGFGDGDETTDIGPKVNNRWTAYFRHKFTVADLSEITDLSITLLYDDGAVIYINDQEIRRVEMPATGLIGYSTPAVGNGSDNKTITFTVPIGVLHDGLNIVAVEVHQREYNSSDISFDLRLTGKKQLGGGGEKTEKILTQSTRVKARIKSGSAWSALNEAVFAVGPIVENLRITEMMYNPQDPNAEFIELKNIGVDPINIGLVSFTNGIDFTFPSLELGSGDYVLVAQSPTELAAVSPSIPPWVQILGPYTGRLNDGGDKIVLVDAIGRTIHEFDYEDSWDELTDGLGFSLTVVNPADTDLNNWDYKYGWRSSFLEGGTPGFADSALAADSIVINEILAHSHDTDSDWIELYNTTDQDLYIGGWFLSDDDSDPNAIRKYEIPADTTIKANSYKVFIENLSFGDPSLPQGQGFGLSEGGETVYLYSGDNGRITGYYQTQQKFDASERGVTFGRYEKEELSDGYDFVRMAWPTQGFANSNPLVPQVVITEIYYNPDNDTAWEFVELYNRSGSDVTLMTQVTTEISPGVIINEEIPWRIEGTGYEFPSDTVIKAGEYILVAKDPTKYNSAPCYVYGPYDGKLDNGGEEIAIQIPGDKEYGEDRYWIPVEKIDYDDQIPWPASADGKGDSLHRINVTTYSRDYSNWQEAMPTPGS